MNDNSADLNEALEKARQNESKAIAQLHALASEVDAEHLFFALFIKLIVASTDQPPTEVTHAGAPVKLELLAYELFPYFGKRGCREINDHDLAIAQELLNTLVNSKAFSGAISQSKRDRLDELLTHFKLHASLVRGSAYPQQTTEEILEIQGRFDQWFERKVGISPSCAVKLLAQIERALHYKVNSEPDIVDTLAGTVRLPVSKAEITIANSPTKEEWQALCNLIGLSKEVRTTIKTPEQMIQRPLYIFGDDRVLLGDLSNTFDQLWEVFDREARQDKKFYDTKYQKWAAEWLQLKIADCLKRLFPEDCIYGELNYPDPDKSNEATTSLDVAVHWPPFLILVEAKAKQFRLASQLGDVGRLRTDLKANITDAFDQTLRVVRYINSVDEACFIESSSGRKLTIKRGEIQRTYLLTVSLHELAGVASQLALLKPLGLFQSGKYPWASSIADLDLISRFCEGPDVFLHYVEKKIEIQTVQEETWILGDEIEFFGAYLKTRLQAQSLWQQGKRKPSGGILAGFQDDFDQWMYFQQGLARRCPEIKLNVPPVITEILRELRNSGDIDSRWIAFSILSLSDRALVVIQEMFDQMRCQNIPSGQFRRLVHKERDVVISLTGSSEPKLELLHERTVLRGQIEKYRHRYSKSIAFGLFIPDRSKPYHAVVWLEGPWKESEALKQLVEREPPFTLAPGTLLPGRNDLCICGSGRKFKKCCMSKIERKRVVDNANAAR